MKTSFRFLQANTFFTTVFILNILLGGLSYWTMQKPSKAWMISSTAEGQAYRNIASVQEEVESKYISSFESWSFHCKDGNFKTSADYIRFADSDCLKDKIIESVRHIETKIEASLMVNAETRGTDYLLLKPGKNTIIVKTANKSYSYSIEKL